VFQFWQKEKKQDTDRKEALSAHEQAKLKTMAAAKEAEQQRLAQQAKQRYKNIGNRSCNNNTYIVNTA
jgi:hypothetical protein